MKNNKIVLAVLMTGALITSMLAGCSNSGTAATTAAPTTETQQSAAPTTETQQSAAADNEAYLAAVKRNADNTGKYEIWEGPTSGPKLIDKDVTVALIDLDQSNGGSTAWGDGFIAACEDVGWNYKRLDGQNDFTVIMSAFSQAIALGVDAIVFTGDAASVQSSILEAKEKGIPTFGIGSSSVSGPDEANNLIYDNLTEPEVIGKAMADYAIADSNGTGRVIILYVSGAQIAEAKANAMKAEIEACDTMTLLEFSSVGTADITTNIASNCASWVSTYGDDFYILTVADAFSDFMIPTLRNGDISTDSVRIIGADGDTSAYTRIRNGEYQIATVPLPSTLYGYMAIDEINRYLCGEEQFVWDPHVHVVTKDNIDVEIENNTWVPSVDYESHYKTIWGIE